MDWNAISFKLDKMSLRITKSVKLEGRVSFAQAYGNFFIGNHDIF